MFILIPIGTVFVIIWEIFHEKISLGLVPLLLLVNLVSGFKYQFKPYSSPWFSAACAAATVHRNYFFCLYQQNESSESKVKFRQSSNGCKRVLESSKLTYVNKTRVHYFQKRGSQDFCWQTNNSVLNKGKSAILALYNDPDVFSSAFDKAKLFT